MRGTWPSEQSQCGHSKLCWSPQYSLYISNASIVVWMLLVSLLIYNISDEQGNYFARF